jgi:L-malate glycosyltransferase
MRVTHLDTGRQMRGGQWQVLALLRGLRDRGIDQVLTTPTRSLLGAKARDEGFAWEALSSMPWGSGTTADIVHAHDGKAHTRGWLSGVQNLIVSRRVAFPVKRGWLSRRKYAWPKRYLAVSAFVKSRLIEAGIEPTRIRVVYDGVEPLPQARAYRTIAIDFDDTRKLTALIREGAALANVEVHFTKDLVADLADARAFVYLSDSEGLGSAILLAQSAGVPVIASNVGGIPEIVRHGETGFLVENDAPTLAAALLGLKNRDRADAMAQAAREQAHTRFSIDAMVDATLAVYREVAGV